MLVYKEISGFGDTDPVQVPFQAPFKAIKKGDRGTNVRNMQRLLLQAGYQIGTADGVFGKRTDWAVRELQKSIRTIPVDGILGNKTYVALMNVTGKRIKINIPAPPPDIKTSLIKDLAPKKTLINKKTLAYIMIGGGILATLALILALRKRV